MTDPQATVRLASLGDAREIAKVQVASWHESYVGMVPANMLSALSVDARAALWTQVIGSTEKPRPTNVYVAEIANRVVGFGSCGLQRTQLHKSEGYVGEISALYLLRAFQGKGIGARLLRELTTDLSHGTIEPASLWVLRDNTRARGFYERYG